MVHASEGAFDDGDGDDGEGNNGRGGDSLASVKELDRGNCILARGSR